MDLYTDCPECDGKGYDAGTMTCQRCNGSGIVPVRVKALEWEAASVYNGRPWLWSAGPYSVNLVEQTYRPSIKTMRYGYPRDVFTSIGDADGYATLEQAQAACQEHHERMVMDMLEVV